MSCQPHHLFSLQTGCDPCLYADGMTLKTIGAVGHIRSLSTAVEVIEDDLSVSTLYTSVLLHL